MSMKITHASHLTDQELTTALRRLAQDEREATVALIVHLAEFDARRLYESLFGEDPDIGPTLAAAVRGA